jgi:biotin-independent malonate decarboxylase gamma subunit
MTRGSAWALRLLEDGRRVETFPASLCVIDGTIATQGYRAVAVVPDPQARSPRARAGEVGLDEALAIADAVRSARPGDAIVAVVDLPGQAFGRREEAAGLHLALAAAVDAYVTERRHGRQIFALLVGKAISGGFLAHGMQAGWIGALDDAGVEVHVMSAASVARVTRARPEEVARLATVIPATARDVNAFASFGAIDALFDVRDPHEPSVSEVATVRAAIAQARALQLGLRAPVERLKRRAAASTRSVALDIRKRITEAW